MADKKKILCVDDNQDNVELLKFCLEKEGYEITDCGTSAECLEHLKKTQFSVIILDYILSDRDGLGVCREIKAKHPNTRVLFFSGDARQVTRNLALKAGADAYLIKPNDFDKLSATIISLL